MDTVALIRDLAIIAFVGLGSLVMLVAGITGLLIYRRVAPMLDSARDATKQVKEATNLLTEKVVKPLAGASASAYTVGRVVAFIMGVSRGKGGRKDGKRS